MMKTVFSLVMIKTVYSGLATLPCRKNFSSSSSFPLAMMKTVYLLVHKPARPSIPKLQLHSKAISSSDAPASLRLFRAGQCVSNAAAFEEEAPVVDRVAKDVLNDIVEKSVDIVGPLLPSPTLILF
jgi:hypothetical protein